MRLHDYLDYRARELPTIVFAQMEGGRSLSYPEAREESCRIGNALVAAGLSPGDRVAFLSKNSVELALFYYAASRVGVVPVPLNYRLAAPEWAYIINDSQAKLLFAQPSLAAALAPAEGELTTVTRKIAVGGAVEGWETWEDFLGSAGTAPPDRDVGTNDDVYQMYTSGTTGRPKGAVLTHEAVSRQIQQAHMAFGGDPGDRALIVAPLYHAAASITAFVTVGGGGTLYIQEDYEPTATVNALAGENIRIALLVPAMIQFCMAAVPDVKERSYDSLRTIVYGASPISEQTLREAIEVFGCEFLQGYGMTETTAALTYLMPKDHERALASDPGLLLSAGRPLVGTEVRIVDENDKPLPNGTIGEVIGRGPQLMRGYWNLPEASEAALRGGWMHTGDAGILDDDGYLYIQDRVKDMIVSGGENVYPREVEEVLFQHPAVADAAVIGVPSEQWGEECKAVVVKKEGAEVTAEEIMEFCKGQLGGYKRPRSVDFIDALPRNPTGKVLKKDLREPYWKGHERRVS